MRCLRRLRWLFRRVDQPRTRKFSQAELIELFGPTLPMDAVMFLYDAPKKQYTLDYIEMRLKEMAHHWRTKEPFILYNSATGETRLFEGRDAAVKNQTEDEELLTQIEFAGRMDTWTASG